MIVLKPGIDGGHGKTDPGSVSPIRPSLGDTIYTEEDDITLAIAKRLQSIFLACGHEPVMTRIGDQYMSLYQRSNLLNKASCDVAISVHINSTINSTAKYISTFIQETGGPAEKLANCIQPLLVKASGWPDGGVKVANLHMTRETKMPAVLVELGFISNPEEEKQLIKKEFQGKLAAAIAEGTMAYAGAVHSWQKLLLTYAWNTYAGEDEIIRAQGVYNLKMMQGDHAGAEAAHKWADQVRMSMGRLKIGG